MKSTATLTDYTSYDDIRAALSISDSELDDPVLCLPVFLTFFGEDLDGVGEGVDDLYWTLKDQTLSNDQARFVRLVGTFATYSVAKQLTATLRLLAVQSETDAKAGYARFANPFDPTVQMINTYYTRIRASLIDAYNKISDSAIEAAGTNTYTPTLGVGIGTDPVTDT